MSRASRRSNRWIPLEPFEEGKPNTSPDFLHRMGITTEKEIREWKVARVFSNDKYTVFVRNYPETKTMWLSIKRNDQNAIHDWRDLQQIKNMLVGEECEAVELYPAESRKVDQANQYHLWASTDPTFRFPVGYSEGQISGPKEARKTMAKQRA